MASTPSAVTSSPAVNKVVAALLPLVAIVLAVWHPHHTVTTAAAQGAVVLGGLLAGAVVFAVHLVGVNGLTKAGLEKTLSEEEAWVKDNFATLKSTYEAAKPALDAIPGVPAALTAVQNDVAVVKGQLANIPVDQVNALLTALKAAPAAAPAEVVAPANPVAAQAS